MEEKNNIPTGSHEPDMNTDSDSVNAHLRNPGEAAESGEKLLQELDELKDKYQRLFAEFDNFKKRSARERIEMIQTAGKDILVSLLEVLDDVDRAAKQMESLNDAQQIKEGNQLIFSKFRNKLLQRGLKPMSCIGEPFNAEMHEAVTLLPAGPDKKGVIIDELEKGYYLNDKIVRFAKVVVGE
jgi:molecular chaperone GrpE